MASFLRSFARKFLKSKEPVEPKSSLAAIVALVARTIPLVGRLTSEDLRLVSIHIYADGRGDIRLTAPSGTFIFPITLEDRSGAFASLTEEVVLAIRSDAVGPGFQGLMKALQR